MPVHVWGLALNATECHRSIHPYTHTGTKPMSQEPVHNHVVVVGADVHMPLNTKCSEIKLTCDMFEMSINIHVGCIVVEASH